MPTEKTPSAAAPRVSIIVRARNEERWIGACLRAIGEQDFADSEVILVDNESTDATVRRAQQYGVSVVPVVDYTPGRALNAGIRASRGGILVFLSAHCIPVNNGWLRTLVAGLDDPTIAGVYGRQQPMAFTSPLDRRDLTIVFGLDRRIQTKDPFFHNANAAIRRDVWERIPFDDEVTNIEDRHWAEQALRLGYRLLYEPEASVYHHHGIHHDQHEQRAQMTAQVLDLIHGEDDQYRAGVLDAEKLHIVALVPQRGLGLMVGGEPLLGMTLDATRASRLLNDTFVLTDDTEAVEYAGRNGAKALLRDPQYSAPDVNLSTVYAYCLARLHDEGLDAELVVLLEPTYPFRPAGLIDDLITQLLIGGYDSVLPARAEYNPCWVDGPDGRRCVDAGDVPREFKSPVLVGLKGLACVTHGEFVRDGRTLGDAVGLVRVNDPHAAVEIRSREDLALVPRILQRIGS